MTRMAFTRLDRALVGAAILVGTGFGSFLYFVLLFGVN